MPVAPTSVPVEPLSLSARTQRAFQHECVELFSEVVDVMGVPRSVGQIYGLLFSSPQPLSFSDIVDQLEISKGSASQGLQVLRALGAIKLLSPVEGRTIGMARDFYEPELRLRKLLSGVLQKRLTPMARVGTDRFLRLRRMVEKDERRNVFLLGRIKQLETWRRRFRTALPILSALLGPKNG